MFPEEFLGIAFALAKDGNTRKWNWVFKLDPGPTTFQYLSGPRS
jgi:hypothetical protein